jgi:hypothetical protein
MNTWTEISKEAFILLVGNDEESWRDYKSVELAESSFYFNHGVRLQALTNFISNVTQYYVEDINA